MIVRRSRTGCRETVLVWRDGEAVLLGHQDPRELSGGYDVASEQAMLEQMATLLEALIGGGVGRMSSAGGGGSRNLILAAMIFAVAMTFIDQTIVSIAAPEIQKGARPHEHRRAVGDQRLPAVAGRAVRLRRPAGRHRRAPQDGDARA